MSLCAFPYACSPKTIAISSSTGRR